MLGGVTVTLPPMLLPKLPAPRHPRRRPCQLVHIKNRRTDGDGQQSARLGGGVKVTFNSDLKSPGFVWRIPRQGYPAEGWVQPRRCDPKWVFAAAKPLPGSGVGPEEGGMVVVAGDSGTRALQRDRGCPGKVKSAFSWEAP